MTANPSLSSSRIRHLSESGATDVPGWHSRAFETDVVLFEKTV
jgi:hypothetical protein